MDKNQKLLGFFGPVFGGFSPEADPGTLKIGLSAKNGAECTQNQPRRPILKPFHRGSGGGLCFRTQPESARPKREGPLKRPRCPRTQGSFKRTPGFF